MKLIEAIAYSSGNKAKAINDQGVPVIIQERYSDSNSWYHVWYITQPRIEQRDTTSLRLLGAFHVDAEEDYWSPVG